MQKIQSNIVAINVSKLVALLTEKYGVQATSKFAKVNLDLGATSLPSYQGKAWLIDGEQVANLSIPKGLMREGVKFEDYAVNLTWGVIRAMLNAKSKDYDKAEVIDALEAIGLTLTTTASGQKTVSAPSGLPADILAAIDTPPIYRPRKTHGTKQIKFACSCGQSIYIADRKTCRASSVAASIKCELCGSSFDDMTAPRTSPALELSLS